MNTQRCSYINNESKKVVQLCILKYKFENYIVFLEKYTGVLIIHVHNFVYKMVASVNIRMNGYSKINLGFCEIGGRNPNI